MSWAKLDDQYFFHPKIVAAGRDARDLHLASMAYCAGQLTNGDVGPDALPLLAAMAGISDPVASANRLVEVGLWDKRDDGGWLLHDYLDYNPPRDMVIARRKEAKERMRGLRAMRSPDVRANTERTSQNVRPLPSPSPSPSPVPEEEIAAASPPAPSDPPKQPVKRKRKSDPRTNHPAIQAVREVTNRYPPKPIWDDIIKLLGDEPRVEEMRLCFKEWVKPGFKPTNFAWLFDWYVSGIPPRRATHASVQDKTADVIKRYRERHSGGV